MGTLLTLLLLAVLHAPSAPAGPSSPLYEQMFAAEERKVLATPTQRDDVEFADKLLKTAKSTGADPAFQAILYHRAVDIAGGSAEGVETALRALDVLEAALPKRKDEWRRRRIALYQLRSRAGRTEERTQASDQLASLYCEMAEGKIAAGELAEATALYSRAQYVARGLSSDRRAEIEAKWEDAVRRHRLGERIAQLQAKLKAAPQDAETRTALIRAFLLDLDEPARAAELLNADVGEQYRTYVPAAARPLEEVPAGLCAELAEWYLSLTDQATGKDARVIALGRARRYYQRFLANHAEKDAVRLKAELALQEVAKELSELVGEAGLGSAVYVPSQPEMLDTSFKIVQGNVYEVAASGRWTGGDGVSCGPEGTVVPALRHCLGPQGDNLARFYVGQHPRNSLIGRIGGQKWTFHVGQAARFLAPCSGNLLLGINDAKDAPGPTSRAGRVKVAIRLLEGFSWKPRDGKFTITARIDEMDLLHFTPTGISWEHPGPWERVGLHDGYYPTVINGVYWWPQWATRTRTEELKSDAFAPPRGRSVVVLAVAAARGGCKPLPSPAGSQTSTVQFFDSALGSGTVTAVCAFGKAPPRRPLRR